MVTITPEIHALYRAADKTFIRTFLDEGTSVDSTLVAIIALHTAVANSYRLQLEEHRSTGGDAAPDIANLETKGNA